MNSSLSRWLLIGAVSCLIACAVPAANLTRFAWSGGVTADSVRIKAGMLADAASAWAVVSAFEDFSDPIYSAAQAVSLAIADGVGDFTVTGLQPATAYYYRIEADGQVGDRIGRFTTFTIGPMSFTFVASCGAAQGTLDLITRYNTGTGDATFYFDAGSGRVEIATRRGGNTSPAKNALIYRFCSQP